MHDPASEVKRAAVRYVSIVPPGVVIQARLDLPGELRGYDLVGIDEDHPFVGGLGDAVIVLVLEAGPGALL